MRLLLALVLAALAFVLAFCGGTGVAPLMVLLQQQQQETACQPAPVDDSGSGGGEDGTPQEQAARLTPQQRAIVARIIGIGQQRNLPPRAWQVAIQAGKTESDLENKPYGDRDSLGIFQMRPSMGWGTEAQLQDVDYQINKFYNVLLTVPGWEELPPGTAAQRVERSAYPLRYHRWASLAVELISTTSGLARPVASGCDAMPAPNEAVKRALAFAHAQLGKPYVWGAAGPDAFDCSGLTQQAWAAANVQIPKYSGHQYNVGRKIPLDQAQPGDLVFWGYDSKPEGIYHVALMLDPVQGTVINAPEPGKTIEITRIWDADLLPSVVRPDIRERT